MSNLIKNITKEQIDLVAQESPLSLLCLFEGATPNLFRGEVAVVMRVCGGRSIELPLLDDGEGFNYLYQVYLKSFGDERQTSRAILEMLYERSLEKTHTPMLKLTLFNHVLARMVEVSEIFFEEYVNILTAGFPNELPLSYKKKMWLLSNYDKIKKGEKIVPIPPEKFMEEIVNRRRAFAVSRKTEMLAMEMNTPKEVIFGVAQAFLARERPQRADQFYLDLVAAKLDRVAERQNKSLPMCFRNIDSQELWDMSHGVSDGPARIAENLVKELGDANMRQKEIGQMIDSHLKEDREMREIVLCLRASDYGEDVIRNVIRQYYLVKNAIQFHDCPLMQDQIIGKGALTYPCVQIQQIGRIKGVLPFEIRVSYSPENEKYFLIPNFYLKNVLISRSPNLPMGAIRSELFHPVILMRSILDSLVRITLPKTGSWFLLFVDQDLQLMNSIVLRNSTITGESIHFMFPSKYNFEKNSISTSYLLEVWWKTTYRGYDPDGEMECILEKKDFRKDLRSADLVPYERWFPAMFTPQQYLESDTKVRIRVTMHDLSRHNYMMQLPIIWFDAIMGRTGRFFGKVGQWVLKDNHGLSRDSTAVWAFLHWFKKFPDNKSTLMGLILRLKRYTLVKSGIAFDWEDQNGNKKLSPSWAYFFPSAYRKVATHYKNFRLLSPTEFEKRKSGDPFSFEEI